MSRIGNLPISIPDKVSVSLAEDVVHVKGPKGDLSEKIPACISVEVDGATIRFARADDSRTSRSAHGLARSLVFNMVEGVSSGFERQLVINGVGYRAESKGANWIMFSLGFSHPILYELPGAVEAQINSKAKEPVVTLKSANKQVLGDVAAAIRGLRTPEPYKGKGIRYSDEQIRRKEGKAAGK